MTFFIIPINFAYKFCDIAIGQWLCFVFCFSKYRLFCMALERNKFNFFRIECYYVVIFMITKTFSDIIIWACLWRCKWACFLLPLCRWRDNLRFSSGGNPNQGKSRAKDEMYLADSLERLNRSCVHTIDLCRSIISKEKEEMKYLAYQK